MRSSLPLKAAAALASLAAMSACSDVNPTAPRSLRAPSAAAGDFVPQPNQVLIGGTPAGSFTTYTANESLRDTPSEFWDNLSSDDRPRGSLPNPHTIATTHCNIGYYTSGANIAACAFAITGTTTVPAATYTQYWQDAGTGTKTRASAEVM